MGFQIREYTRIGRIPYRAWLSTLDSVDRARIEARVFRIEQGNMGDVKSVGKGVFESRFTFGPGYRLYFVLRGRRLVVLLGGGNKRTQAKDIRIAQRRWADFLEHHDGKAE